MLRFSVWGAARSLAAGCAQGSSVRLMHVLGGDLAGHGKALLDGCREALVLQFALVGGGLCGRRGRGGVRRAAACRGPAAGHMHGTAWHGVE
jgi:hypothetical protein